jgi:hypothetical protein
MIGAHEVDEETQQNMAPGNAQQTTGSPSSSSITIFQSLTSVQTGPSTIFPTKSGVSPLTNLGPVTTLFTPPSSCFQSSRSYSGRALWLMNQGEGFPGDCWPTVAGGEYLSGGIAPQPFLSQYYSPAVCPSGVSSSLVYYYSTS